MTTTVLTRKPYRRQEAPLLTLSEPLSLAYGRSHELCGPARHSLALMLAGQASGPVLWIRPTWRIEQLHADGAQAYLNPGRIAFANAARLPDMLWCMEEALRSGAAPIVIAELEEPPALTPVRRLHLAAQAAPTKPAPIALILSPGDGGAQGVESRWYIAPRHESGRSLWHLTRLRARMAPPASWQMEWVTRGSVRLAPTTNEAI